MSLTLRTTFGCTEAVIDDDANLNRFYQIAHILSDGLEAVFTKKEDDFDAINWDFSIGKHRLTLYFNIYNGISIFPTKTKDAKKGENNAVMELASVLEGKLMQLPDAVHIIRTIKDAGIVMNSTHDNCSVNVS